MFEILYVPKVEQKLGKSDMILDILFNDDKMSDIATKRVKDIQYDYIRIKKANIYKDIRNAIKKIFSIRTALDGTNETTRKTIYFVISKTLCNEDLFTIEHVLCKLMNSFYMDIQMTNISMIVTHDSGSENAKIKNSVDIASKILAGRMLAMLPANVATPEYVANYIKEMFRDEKGVRVKILNRDQLKREGFGLILGVGDSARNAPKLVIVERTVRSNKKPKKVAIVGKGITFDSGGLAIKPFNHMIDMKFDKIGAVYGCVSLLHLIRRKDMQGISFLGCFPLAENAVSANALRPGDIVKSHLGINVEIANPDAEGRLILADAFGLMHNQKYTPDILIDIATLTGHAGGINCWHSGYFYANDDVMKRDIETLTDKIGERMIPMPTWDDYDDVLKSTVADISNSPYQCSDAFVAARFLNAFVPKGVKWVHIDLAHESELRGVPNGNGIRTIVSIIDRLKEKNEI